jgi:hypothetical protein
VNASGRVVAAGFDARRRRRDRRPGALSRVWVQRGVVVWISFPQRVVAGDRVVFVHGSELVARYEQLLVFSPAGE